MKPTEVLGKNYLRNILIVLLLILLVGTALSALILFINIHRPLNTHYSAILTIITQLKESLLIRTLKVNVIFILLTGAGIGFLILVYTHRIAGPLYRMKLKAKSIAEGRLDSEIKLRRKDAVNFFAESLNEITISYSNRLTHLDSELKQLKAFVNELQTLSDKKDERITMLTRINAVDERIKEFFRNMKF